MDATIDKNAVGEGVEYGGGLGGGSEGGVGGVTFYLGEDGVMK